MASLPATHSIDIRDSSRFCLLSGLNLELHGDSRGGSGRAHDSYWWACDPSTGAIALVGIW